MANENKKINELVSDDDDPTSELDAKTIRHAFHARGELAELEADGNTFDFEDFDDFDDDIKDGVSIADLKSDLKARSETIERLQFDIQQLHSKWLGLETEIKAREELTCDLTNELKSTKRTLDRKEALLHKRDDSIKSLKAEIREREASFRELESLSNEYLEAKTELEASDELGAARQKITEQDGRLAGHEATIWDLRQQLKRTESYADDLRHQLDDVTAESEGAFADRDALRQAASENEDRIEQLKTELDRLVVDANAAEKALADAGEAHEQEIRNLRFELGAAQDTIVERDQINEELASDLVDTRNFKEQLEHMLSDNSEQSQQQIETLESDLKKLKKTVAEYEDKLETKSNAINALLTELAKKSHEIDSIGEMEDVIQEIDDRMSERIDDIPPAPADRVARLLVGRIDKQELRFPLFKDRLTIGRTQQNDIQLKAQFISRRHAVVQTEGEATRVIDWGSKNGVYVNSRRVTEHFLRHGDVLTIGNAKFRYEERPIRDT